MTSEGQCSYAKDDVYTTSESKIRHSANENRAYFDLFDFLDKEKYFADLAEKRG